MRVFFFYSDIEQREREIAAREGIDWDRIDRDWVRREALKQLRSERGEEQR